MSKKIYKPKRIIFFLFLFSFIFLVLKISLEKFLLNFSYFKIKEIEFINGEINLDHLRDNSIFSINLRKISEYLLSKHPQFREIILNFQFPGRLSVQIKEHTAFAKLLLLYGQFPVDEEGRILRKDIVSDLPEILGLQNKIISPKFYETYTVPELLLSLDLIRMSPQKIKKIDATKKEDLTIFLDSGLRVKIGHRDYPERLKDLSLILEELKISEDIDYIDLRFSDPIIKYKK